MLAPVQLAPARGERAVVLAPAQGAGAVARCERRRLVEEEELGEPAGLQQRRAVPAAERQLAGDPAPACEAPANGPVSVVQAAAVAVDETASGFRHELTQRRDPVLQRRSSLLRHVDAS